MLTWPRLFQNNQLELFKENSKFPLFSYVRIDNHFFHGYFCLSLQYFGIEKAELGSNFLIYKMDSFQNFLQKILENSWISFLILSEKKFSFYPH